MPKQSATDTRPDRVKRIALSAAHGHSLAGTYMPLITRLLESGHRVLCLAPQISEGETLSLTHAGADVRQLNLVADRWTLMPERQIVQRTTSILSEWQADTVLARGSGVMPAVSLAAKKAGAARIIAVQEQLPPEADEENGSEGDPEDSLIRAFDAATDVLCYNYDHAAQLEISGLLPEDLTPVVLPGLGVDLDQLQVAPLPPIGDELCFLMIAELALSSGVLDFCKAAEIVKEHAPQTKFQLAGPASRSHDALSLADVEPYGETVSYVGDGADTPSLIAQCHVFVYPSHGEASPGPALQALAMGRAIVTTDAPGCRELVDERVNGVLCAPGEPVSLAASMQRSVKWPDLIPAMARASHQKAERRYDRRLVLAALFDLLGLQRAAITEA